jgi:NADPH-dependent 2,4-dienoyl-CoA reductase/sulfur reductase-like enzyme/nitrite reductase/ring-hydroxylating ferredoxin subunit
MATSKDAPERDLRAGVPLRDIPDGSMITGRAGEDEVLIARRRDVFFAIGAHCTHYHGPLAEGLMVGDTVRCPWHHACFDLRTGEPVRAPAMDPVDCWRVERVGDTVFVREKIAPKVAPRRPSVTPESVVILGGGAAGFAAAEMLRRDGYDGPITMLSADDAAPVDRPNLSKDYLAGTAKEDWIPMRPPEFYTDQKIDLRLGVRATSIDVKRRSVQLDGGTAHTFGALLIATGAEPVKLDTPVTGGAAVRYLRTFADSRAIVAAAGSAKTALVIGASFIALEVAASLRTRGLAVHVVAPDRQPLERVMGPEVGQFLRKVHEDHGVVFHLGTTVTSIDGRKAILSDGSTVEADLVVAGVGVRPSMAIAEQAGLAVDRGVTVNEYLETSAPNVFAAGDIARWPDPHTGERIRVEHWVVAERQGQYAARNILGKRERFNLVPFFWSQHYDLTINYVGHAEKWDKVEIDGRLEDHDAAVTYSKGGHDLAVATLFRDHESLEAELDMETEAGPEPPTTPGVPASLRYD